MDISKLSNEDLLALHNKQYDKLSNEGLMFLHTSNQSQQTPQAPGVVDQLKSGFKQYSDSLPPVRNAKGQVNTSIDQNDPNMRMATEAGQGVAVNAAADRLIKPVLSAIAGPIKGIGDRILQRSVGLKKYIPGVGETMADEGIIGTQGMMRGQVEKALETRGQEIGSLARSVPEVSTQPIAENIGQRASRLIGPDGKIMPENIAEFNKYADAASKVSSENALTGETTAFRRAAQGKVAKNAGRYRDNPAQGLKSQLAGTQQSAYSQALKNAPGAPAGLAEADRAYGALSQVDAAMSRPESLSSMSMMGKFVPTSLAESAMGRSLIGLGRGVESNASNNAIKAAPMTLADLLKLNKE